MRAAPIPREVAWPHSVRQVIGAPDGDLTGESGIEPVEVIIDAVEIGGSGWPRFNIRIVLDDDEVARIVAGHRVIWLSQLGRQLHPFQMSLDQPDGNIDRTPETLTPREP